MGDTRPRLLVVWSLRRNKGYLRLCHKVNKQARHLLSVLLWGCPNRWDRLPDKPRPMYSLHWIQSFVAALELEFQLAPIGNQSALLFVLSVCLCIVSLPVQAHLYNLLPGYQSRAELAVLVVLDTRPRLLVCLQLLYPEQKAVKVEDHYI